MNSRTAPSKPSAKIPMIRDFCSVFFSHPITRYEYGMTIRAMHNHTAQPTAIAARTGIGIVPRSIQRKQTAMVVR